MRHWLCALTLLLAAAAPAGAVEHGALDELLAQHVQQGRVDYAGLQSKRGSLEGYLRSLAAVAPAGLSRKERLAFWINAYNAVALLQVLDARQPVSVKDLKGFFDKKTHAVGGEMLTLDQIEQRGRLLGDWRIHFALSPATVGGPLLRDEAYHPDWLDAQLAEQARQHLADPARGLRYDPKSSTLWGARAFQRHPKDFVPKGPLNAETLLPVLEPYLDARLAATLKARPSRLKFLEYDWSLNNTSPRAR